MLRGQPCPWPWLQLTASSAGTIRRHVSACVCLSSYYTIFFPYILQELWGKKTDGLGASFIACISGCLAKSPFLSPSDAACSPPPNHLVCPLLHPHSCCFRTCKRPSSYAEIANTFLFLMSICLCTCCSLCLQCPSPPLCPTNLNLNLPLKP